MFLFLEFLLINLESFPFSMLAVMSHILIPYFCPLHLLASYQAFMNHHRCCSSQCCDAQVFSVYVLLHISVHSFQTSAGQQMDLVDICTILFVKQSVPLLCFLPFYDVPGLCFLLFYDVPGFMLRKLLYNFLFSYQKTYTATDKGKVIIEY